MLTFECKHTCSVYLLARNQVEGELLVMVLGQGSVQECNIRETLEDQEFLQGHTFSSIVLPGLNSDQATIQQP